MPRPTLSIVGDASKPTELTSAGLLPRPSSRAIESQCRRNSPSVCAARVGRDNGGRVTNDDGFELVVADAAVWGRPARVVEALISGPRVPGAEAVGQSAEHLGGGDTEAYDASRSQEFDFEFEHPAAPQFEIGGGREGSGVAINVGEPDVRPWRGTSRAAARQRAALGVGATSPGSRRCLG